MGKMNVPPTRSNYMEIQRNLEFAQEGSDLLEQKRQILVMELMNRLEAAKRLQDEVDSKMAAAYEAFREAALKIGSETLDRLAVGISLTHKLKLDTHTLMGLRIPKVDTEHEQADISSAASASSPAADAVLKKFGEALEVIGRLAEVQTVVFRVARELKKTQRRVNALDKIFLPDYRETLKYIEDTLDERERESFIIMKMLKQRKS